MPAPDHGTHPELPEWLAGADADWNVLEALDEDDEIEITTSRDLGFTLGDTRLTHTRNLAYD